MVLMSANNRLYGDILPKIYKLFYEQAKGNSADIVIVGKQGKEFVEQLKLPNPYTYLEMPDTTIPQHIIKQLTDILYPYEKVTVFCGKFNNIISQVAVQTDISGHLPEENESEKAALKFLIEPSIEEVINFFETLIFALLLDQTIHESILARFASRIKAMEAAQNYIEKQLKLTMIKQRRQKDMDSNRKQLELFAGRSLWGKS